MNALNTIGKKFAVALAAERRRHQQIDELNLVSPKVHVVGAGRTITSAYEQLRNAAEYTEEHLLLQRAIKRFYKRLFITNNPAHISSSGEEIVTELTLAGYLQNDTVSTDKLKTLNDLATDYYIAHDKLKGVSQSSDKWTIDVLSVEVGKLLSDNSSRDVFLQFAFDNFLETFDKKSIFKVGVPVDYELSLYVAVHRALLKSDEATIRWAFLRRFRQTPSNFETYVQANEKADELLNSKTSEKLFRLVNRQGAVYRIIWRMMNERDNFEDMLHSQSKFVSAFEAQVNTEYSQINKRVNKGIIKSVVFLIITKFLIGIAIEVPYDYLMHGSIIWPALLVNLFAPPVYMVLLRFTLTMPTGANTRALIDRAEGLLFKDDNTINLSRVANKTYGAAFNVAYALFFVAIFGFASWGLISIGFSIVHLVIFFAFFSAASFLGFRLSRIIRELETVESEQTGVSIIRDFLYMPFVVVGRWMSDKYSRVNIVAMTLDMIIELPLKTVLRLVRQWGVFISTKKDNL